MNGDFMVDSAARQSSERSPARHPMVWPERSVWEWVLGLSLFGISVVFLWPFRDYSALFGDEGIFLQGAQRILLGQVPYRDLFTYFTPGSYYWIALRFKLLGTSLFAGRVILLAYGGVFSVVLYMLARRTCSRRVAALVAWLFLVIGLPYRFVVLHNWDSTVLALLALYAAVAWVQSARWVWALAAGILVSLTCLFDQPKGFGLIVGLGLGLLIIAWRPPLSGIFNRQNMGAAVAGFSGPALLTFAYFASQDSLGKMVQDCLWPLTHVGRYSNVNHLPYGYVPLRFESWEMLYGSGSLLERTFFVLLTSPFFVIPALPVLAVIVLIISARKVGNEESSRAVNSYYVLVSATGIGLVLGMIATGRPEYDHLIYVAPPMFLLLGSFLGGRSFSTPWLVSLRPILAAFLLVTFTGFGLKLLVGGPLRATHGLETRRGRLLLPGRDAVIPYIEEHIARGDKLFVYPYQPLYYFLTATSNSTQFEYLQLGLHAPEHMERAIAELETDRTPTIIYAPAFNSWVIPQTFPATPQKVLDSDPVRDYIFAHYRVCEILPSLEWPYAFMRRRELPCPADSGDNGQAAAH